MSKITKNQASKGNDKAAAWVKLAPVLAAAGALADAVERFQEDPDAKALAGDADVSRLLHELAQFSHEQSGLIAEAAAVAVAQ